jgi:hypothetical protein
MKHNLTSIITYLLLVLSIGIFFGTTYFVMNIKVLDDWQLTLPAGEIHVGDTVVLQSSYKKLREAGGESVRYIQCQNRNGVWIRYELNRATANRQAGVGGTGVVLTVRRDIADVPTTCKFTISIRYDVLPFRDVYVSNETKQFKLLTERTEPASGVSAATTENNQSPAAPADPAPIQSSVSYLQPTPIPLIQQPNSSQAATEPPESAPPAPPQSIIERLMDTVRGIL